jgi:hypothetical protein
MKKENYIVRSVPNLAKRAYGNLRVLSPTGKLMFLAGLPKLKFYLDRGLVKQIDSDTYQLTFEPKGLGYSSETSILKLGEFSTIPPSRENRCVVSGETDLNKLNKHHIVPRCFRKHFPLKEKSNFQMLVMIDVKVHGLYTIEEQKYYDVIAKELGVNNWDSFREDLPTKKLQGYSKSLYIHGDSIPEDRRNEMELVFIQETGLQPTKYNLSQYMYTDISERKEMTVDNNFGMAIAAKIIDYREFEIKWLNHFVETMKPKFLPLDLINGYGLSDKIKELVV